MTRLPLPSKNEKCENGLSVRANELLGGLTALTSTIRPIVLHRMFCLLYSPVRCASTKKSFATKVAKLSQGWGVCSSSGITAMLSQADKTSPGVHCLGALKTVVIGKEAFSETRTRIR